jgi:hypothetical protein
MEAITSNVATYASPLGLKTASQHYVKDPNNVQNYILNRTESYGYDADRDYLTSCTMGGSTRTWTYDPAGNRTGDSANTGTWTYDNLNRMTASPGQTYTYDAVGNMTGPSPCLWAEERSDEGESAMLRHRLPLHINKPEGSKCKRTKPQPPTAPQRFERSKAPSSARTTQR